MLIPSVNRYESHIRPFSFTCAHKFLPISCETNTFNSLGACSSFRSHARMAKVEARSCYLLLIFWAFQPALSSKQIVSSSCWPPLLPTLLPTFHWNTSKCVEVWFKKDSLTIFSKRAFQIAEKQIQVTADITRHDQQIHWGNAIILPFLNLQQATFGSKLT